MAICSSSTAHAPDALERLLDPVTWSIGLLAFGGAHLVAFGVPKLLQSDPQAYFFVLLLIPVLTVLFALTLRMGFLARQSLLVRFGLLIVAVWMSSFLSIWLGGRALNPAYAPRDVALFVTSLTTTTNSEPFMSSQFYNGPELLAMRAMIQTFSALWFLQLTLVLIPRALITAATPVEALNYRADIAKEQSLATVSRMITRAFALLLVAATIAFFFAGNQPFEAYALAAGTLSLGGYLLPYYDGGLLYKSDATQAIAVVVMLIAAAGFARHVRFLRTGRVSVYLKSRECRAMVLLLVGFIFLPFMLGGILIAANDFGESNSTLQTLQSVAVTMVSMMTTTAPNFDGAEQFSYLAGSIGGETTVLFLGCVAGFIGGCAGSSAGGMKIARLLGLYDYVLGVLRNRHVISTSQSAIPVTYYHMMPFFLLLWLLGLIVGTVALFLGGVSLDQAALAVALSLTNTGLGDTTVFLADWPDWTIGVLMVLMVLGRLEFAIVASFLSWRYWSSGTFIQGAAQSRAAR